MARQNAVEKPALGDDRGGRPGVPRQPAKPGGKAGKAPAKPSAAAAPPAPKVKFRGRVLENEPLARHTTYRIGGSARYLLLPSAVDVVVKLLELAPDPGTTWGGVVLGIIGVG